MYVSAFPHSSPLFVFKACLTICRQTCFLFLIEVILGSFAYLHDCEETKIDQDRRNAKIAGMEDDLNLTGNRYSWLLTIFYISYVVFEFGAFMWKVMPPHQWAAITVLSW